MVWESICKCIIAKVNLGRSITKAIFNGSPNVPVLAQLADSFLLLSVRAATRGLLIALNEDAISRDTPDFLTTALVIVIQGSVTFFIFKEVTE